MKGFQLTEIGYIPEDWTVGRLDDFFEVQQGKQVSKANRIGSNQKPFLRTSNILWGKITLDKLDYLHFTADEEKKYKLSQNDLLVCEGGDIGRTGIWKNELDGCYYQNHLHRLRAKTSEIDPEFVLYWLQFSFVYAKLYFGRGNITTIPNLSKSRLSELLIPVPTLIEQRNIAFVMKTLQIAVDLQDKLIQSTKELKRILMQLLLTQGTPGENQKHIETGVLPKSWQIKHLIDAVEFIDYGVSQAIPKTSSKKGVKIVSTADINRDGELLYDQIRTIEVPERTVEKLMLKDGDLLFNWRNSAELIGKSTVFHEQSEPHIFASFILRINCGEIKSHNYFLKYLMNHYREEGVFIKLSRRAVNQANFNRNEISVLPIPVPPYQEQIEIAKLIGTVERKINHHKNKKQALNDLFKTLLNDLMTGKHKVNEIGFQDISKEYDLVKQSLDLAAEI